MTFYAQMPSGLGRILLCSNGTHLTGLYFIGQKDCPSLNGLPLPLPRAGDPTAGFLSGVAIKRFKARRPLDDDLFGHSNLHRTNADTATPVPGDERHDALIDSSPDAPLPMQADTPGAVLALFEQAQKELHQYFRGARKAFTVPLHLEGTEFQKKVWHALLDIPYGESVSYGQVARSAGLTPQHGRPVGTAVGRNPITIIVPCHRVLGGSGMLTGYTGGLERKFALLELEGFRLG